MVQNRSTQTTFSYLGGVTERLNSGPEAQQSINTEVASLARQLAMLQLKLDRAQPVKTTSPAHGKYQLYFREPVEANAVVKLLVDCVSEALSCQCLRSEAHCQVEFIEGDSTQPT